MGRAQLHSPVFHHFRHHVGDGGVPFAPVVPYGAQALVHIFRQLCTHNAVVKQMAAKQFFHIKISQIQSLLTVDKKQKQDTKNDLFCPVYYSKMVVSYCTMGDGEATRGERSNLR
ncbi:hypothetical protein SDC9_197870 [bioreactor metagenome]|uniref:Uncharacterized protein n=1 Tax=bioreactor metagenome TaxID=1076179 RepID=A0A645IPH6_9ZZZZ